MIVPLKTAVITGAGQGMGRAVALTFAANDVHVVLVGRTKDKLDSVANEVSTLGGTAAVHAMDVTHLDEVNALAQQHANESVDVLVNCAGEALIKPFQETTDDDLELLLDINLKGPYRMARALLPSLRKSGNASIINIGSIVAIEGKPGVSAYSASKMGLRGVSEALSAELHQDNIRVIMLAPGPADTPMRWAATPDFDRNMLIAPEAVAGIVWHLVNLPPGTTTNTFLLRSSYLAL